MTNKNPVERLKQIYEDTIENGETFNGDINNIDFYSLMCKATASNNLYKLFSCNLFMFKYTYEEVDSILIIFSIPASLNKDNDKENKHLSERIMDVLKTIEDCFIFIDYMNLKNIKEDNFSYLTVIKKIQNERNNND